MKFFTNKSIWSKIVIVLVMILLLQFCLSRPVHAEDEGVGGKLLSPIVELVLALLDGIVDLLHSSVMGQSESLIRIDMSDSFWQKALTFLVGIVAGIVAAVVIIGTGGLAAVAGTVAAVGAGISIVVKSAAIGLVAAVMFENTFYPDDMYLPIYTYSPEEIFKGNILLFDVDFFNPETEIYMKTNSDNDYKLSDYEEQDVGEQTLEEKAQAEGGIKYYFYKDGDKEIITSKQNTAYDLQETISRWYVSIRNIVLVLMMSVLLYIGIRMLLSSISAEKAKYKQMLTDWTVSICLIFFMHYIMAFSVTIVKNLTLSISAIDQNSNNNEIYSVSLQDDKENKLTEKVKDLYGEQKANDEFITEQTITNSEGETETSEFVTWPTNLMGKLRLQAQMSNGDVSFIGYAVCFAMLVFYTVFFTFTYLKRVVYLAFLTIIAPFVALTYPIDKISDGSAQGFNKWLKEYVFNLLIQPLHLILYTVLISAAFELSSTNIIYSIVAIGFLIPAEKLLRSLFGFEKAVTPGSLAGAAIGGSLINQGLNKLLHKGPSSGGRKGISSGTGGNSSSEGDSKINFQDDNFDAYQTLGDDVNKGTSQQQMLDAYDEGYGTQGWNAQERDAMAREASLNSNNSMNYSADEYAQILRDSGYEEKDVQNMLSQDPRYSSNNLQLQEQGRGKVSKISNSRPVRMIKGVGRVGMLGARKLYDNKGQIAKQAIKMTAATAVAGAATAATAVAAGTIGLAAGAATGDFDNAVKYGLGAAGAGGLAGLNMSTSGINSMGSAIKTVKDSENIQRAYYGDRFEEHRTQKNISEWKKKNKGELEKEYGVKKASKMMKDGTIDQYLNANISSTEDIIALQKLQDDKIIKNFEQARAVHKLANMTGDTTKMKAKDRKEWQTTMKEKYIEKNYSEQQAQNASNESMRLVNEYYKNRK